MIDMNKIYVIIVVFTAIGVTGLVYKKERNKDGNFWKQYDKKG
jgi:hypothetical protein